MKLEQSNIKKTYNILHSTCFNVIITGFCWLKTIKNILKEWIEFHYASSTRPSFLQIIDTVHHYGSVYVNMSVQYTFEHWVIYI